MLTNLSDPSVRLNSVLILRFCSLIFVRRTFEVTKTFDGTLVNFQESYDKYWAEKSNDAMLCGNLLVNLEKEEKYEAFEIRFFKLKKNDVSDV